MTKETIKEQAALCDINSVSNRFRFTYHSCNKELFVELEAENLNKAMIEFATYYHQIDEVYEIVKV